MLFYIISHASQGHGKQKLSTYTFPFEKKTSFNLKKVVPSRGKKRHTVKPKVQTLLMSVGKDSRILYATNFTTDS